MVLCCVQDTVPRIGKFLTLFSRPGKRVIIDYRGDVVVRPSPYEIFLRSGELESLHQAPARVSCCSQVVKGQQIV